MINCWSSVVCLGLCCHRLCNSPLFYRMAHPPRTLDGNLGYAFYCPFFLPVGVIRFEAGGGELAVCIPIKRLARTHQKNTVLLMSFLKANIRVYKTAIGKGR